MNPIRIAYFSGTGNTDLVARFVEEEFQALGHSARLERIEESSADGSSAADEILGIGFPVHGFGAPSIVARYVKQLPPGTGRKAFVFATAGDLVSLNRAAVASVSARLERRGYIVVREDLIPMPANFAIQYPADLQWHLCFRAQERAREIAGAVARGEVSRFRVRLRTRAAARALCACEQRGGLLFGKDLHASASCTGCETCVKNCPTRNISRLGSKIHFGWRCLACMRCVYSCPPRAIAPRLERFLVLKDGYDIRAVASSPVPERASREWEPRILYGRLSAYVNAGARSPHPSARP